MGTVFLHGNGGSGGSGGGIELTIIVDTVRPAKVTHNVIWIDSDVDATSYALTAAEPENPEAGALWISIGDGGKIKVVSPVGDNWITVYPISAKQFIDGEWVDKAAKSYQNGEWVDWWDGLKLYDKGNLHTDATGGWLEVLGSSGTVTWNADNVYLGHSASGGRYSSIYTKNPVRFDDYKKLCVRVSELTIGNDRFLFGAISTPYTAVAASSAESKYAAFAKLTASNSAEQILELDVSALSGSYYVQIVAGITKVYIHEIYLE